MIVHRSVAKTLEDLGVQPRSLQDMASIVSNPYTAFKSMDDEYIRAQVTIPKLIPVDD